MRIYLISLLLILLSVQQIRGQIGENYTSIVTVRNGNVFSDKIQYRISYYQEYYYNHKLNLASIYEKVWGAAGWNHRYCEFLVDGVSVGTDENGPVFINITKNITVTIKFRYAYNKGRWLYYDINIKSIPIEWKSIPDLCQDDNRLMLDPFSNAYIKGGEDPRFSGKGIVKDYYNYFDPSVAGTGNHTITYTANEKTYTTTVRVLERPQITNTLLPEYLNTQDKIDLSAYFKPSGGTYSVTVDGSPVVVQSGRYVNPQDIIPLTDFTTARKTAKVTYTVANGGCSSTMTADLNIKSNNVQITFRDIPDQCKSDGEIDLLEYVEPKTGTFSGSGITIEGNRYAKLNKTGTPSITYKVTQEGHTFQVTKYLRVRDVPDVNFKKITDVCVNTPFDLSDFVEPKGGVFSGAGVSGNIFNPDAAGMGTHTIKYTFTDAIGCQNTVTRDIVIRELNSTSLEFLDLPNTCVNGQEIYLPPYIKGYDGGQFSGRGVQGEYFNPSLAGSGNILVSYTYGSSSCKTTMEKYIKVLPMPSFTFNQPPDVCQEDEVINLVDYVTIKTGTFQGTGVTNNKFNSSLAGVGRHEISYTVSSSDGCSTTATRTIYVKAQIPASLKWLKLPDLCTQNQAIDLNQYVTAQGGQFSGRGVTGSYFNPSVAGANQHQLTYTYTDNGCVKTITSIISVSAETAVSFYNIAAVCTKDVIVLNNYVSHTGGTFSGPGVLDNKFYPDEAGIGAHVITYTYKNQLGCETIITKTVNVNMLMDNNVVFKPIENKCTGSPSVYLRDLINISDGTFSGRGVTGEYFNPLAAGIGTWTITWSKTNGSCTQTRTTTVTVVGEPNILWSSIPAICQSNTVIDLGAYINKLGGTFSGPGVVDGKFYSDQAGMGSHQVFYTYKEGDCEVSKSTTIQVNGLLSSNLKFDKIENVCVSDNVIDLNAYVNVPDGTFSGRGVTLGQFSPLQAGAGLHEISYTVKDGLCSKTVKQFVNVIASNSVIFTNIPIICNSSVVDLTRYVEPKGGVFSGVGVQNNSFDPVIAGVGSHTIFYTYTNEAGCETIVTKTISVDQLIAPTSWLPIDAVCGSSTPIYLPQFIEGAQGGQFSGTGVTGEYFDPSKVVSGIYTISYTLSSGRCNEKFTTTIMVMQVSPITFLDVPNICYANKINLNEYVSPSGGRFEGKGIENDFIFDPVVAGRGNHTIRYYYQNANGCESVATKTINVVDILDNIQFNALPASCIEGVQINLRDFLEGTSSGTFSGKGVQGDIFTPKTAGEGLHTIKFIINNGGCLVELSQNIEVFPASNLQWFKINNICYSTKIHLNRYVNISGGVFSGLGVENTGSDYYFNPSVAGIGNHMVTYSIRDKNGCDISMSTTIKVDNIIQEDAYWEDLPRVCVSSEAVYLPDYIGSLGQGTFSGRGVTGKYFNPSVAGAGIHTLSFTITQGTCVLSLETTITVDDANKIVFNTIPDICSTAPVNLNNYVSPQGGRFSGTGIDKDNPLFFNPSQAGLGEFTLTYEYINAAGCKSTATKIIKVVNLLDDNIIFDMDKDNGYCLSDPVVNLRPYVNSVEGTFKGAGITGDFFSPAQAGVGIHKILFQIENNGCKVERYDYISVEKGETVVFSSLGNICYTTRIPLEQLVTPKGGEFSGLGVSDGYFYPERAGKGSHPITYSVKNQRGCQTIFTQNLTVTSLINPDISFGVMPRVCDNSQAVKLTEYVANLNIEASGVFSGRGVDGIYFNPSQAGKGTHTITLTVGESGCRKTFTQTITVAGADNLLLNDLPSVCLTKKINLDNYTTQQGTFSGPGVSANIFDPSLAGIGSHVITFKYSNIAGCEFILQKTIKVVNLLAEEIIFNDLGSYCQNQGGIDLSSFVNVDKKALEFKGSGVDGYYFNPANVNPGTYTITAIIGDSECKTSITKTVTVKGSETVVMSDIAEVCTYQDIDLENYVSHRGGIFVSPYVDGSIFKASVAGVGKHIVSYIYNVTGCETVVQKTINVVELNTPVIEFNVIADICGDSSPVKLSDYVNDKSGKFSGPGVQGEYFNPSVSGVGAWTITYSVGGTKACKREFTQVIIVHPKDDVVFSNIAALCSNDVVDLNNYVSHRGGVFSGGGVNENKFDVMLAGQGNHLITYTYEGHNGCKSVISQVVRVNQIYPDVQFSPVPMMCQNGRTVSLNEYVNIAGGVFSGVGVKGNVFDPKQAGGGNHTITYYLGNDDCKKQVTQTVTVVGIPDVKFQDIPDICFNEKVKLSDFINESGTFSGPGVEGEYFNPSSAGAGMHKILFSYKQDECSLTIEKTINVISVNDVGVRFFPLPSLCGSDQAIDLSEYTNANGNFTGKGVQGNVFQPSLAGPGTHEITFTVGSASCKREYKQYITIFANTTLSNTVEVVICNGEEYNLLSAVNISGGVFSGDNVTGNIFTPSGEGQSLVTYTYQNKNGCHSEIKFLVSVNGMHPKTVMFQNIDPVCLDGDNIDLRKYVSFEGGTFTGKGVQGYYFTPSTAGTGTHEITYTCGAGNCKITSKKTITVNANPAPQITLDNIFCNDVTIDLEDKINVSGASFSGPGIVNNILRTASAGLGKHILKCVYQDSKGCETVINKTFEVKGLNVSDVVFSEIEDYCESDGRIDLRKYLNTSANVVFSGKGVEGYYFNPTIAKKGTHEITATVGLNASCKDQYKQIVNVLSLPVVEFTEIPSICFNTPLDLLDLVSVKEGFFSGRGVSENMFYPDLAGVGTHQIVYLLENSQGCRTEVRKTIEVKSLFSDNIEFNPVGNMCVNSEPVYLNGFVNILSGTFTGNGVSNMSFDPQKAGIGTHEIKYTVGSGNCRKEYLQYITVLPAITVTFSPLPVICQDQVIDLSAYVNIQGGNFSGPAIENNILDTKDLEKGSYDITYYYYDENGCSSTTKQVLSIKDKNLIGANIAFDEIEDICVSSSPVNLDLYVTQTGGQFSGPGVTGKMFDPQKAGSGVHLITYTIGNGECQMILTKEVIVKPSPIISWHDLPVMCYETDMVNLDNYVSHKGGRFSGLGVESGYLKRSLLSNEGIYTITYEYDTENGCTVVVNTSVTVEKTVPEKVNFSHMGNICLNSNRINLFEFVDIHEGEFTGTGVTPDGLFDPRQAGIGEHRIAFKYGSGKCQKQLYQYVSVTSSKEVVFNSPGKKCDSSPLDLTQFVNYKGGEFSGRGVEGNIFNPLASGEGIHLISYLYKEDNCTVKVTQNIEVLNTREVTINVDRSKIESSALVRFWSEGVDVVNAKWQFGDGGYSLEKEPYHYYYHTGTFNLILTCEDTNGCTHRIVKDDFITVSEYANQNKSVITVNDPQAKVGLHDKDETPETNSVTVYPNPFKEKITVETSVKESQIMVYDLTGRILLKEIITDGESQKTIILTGLKPGMYILKVGEKIIKINKI